MEETAKELPKGADYTLTVPLKDGSKAVYHIKEMDEDVYLMAKSLIDKGKDFDAVRMIVKSLKVGGDDVDLLKKNNEFKAMQALANLVLKFMQPVEGELKKN